VIDDPVPARRDLASALVLSIPTGILAALAAAAMVDRVPGARASLPLPLWAFSLALLAQGTGVYGRLEAVPALSWVWLVGLNAVCGALYGGLFLRFGIGAAVAAHFGTDLVWHAVSAAVA